MKFSRRTLYTDFVFNVELDESLFNLEPPADFTVKTVIVREDLTPIEENDLIELFRQCREVGLDVFPDTLDAEGSRVVVDRKFVPSKELTEAQSQKCTEFSMKLDRGPRFVAGLPTEADAHYAGKGVKVDAPDTPIFWYRPEGRDGYRLIRADLSVVEVNSPPEVPGAQAINGWRRAQLARQSPWPDPGARRTFTEGVQAGGELKYVNEIDVVFVGGTPEEIGRQQGLLIADATRPLINLPKDLVRQAGFDFAWPLVVRFCKAGLLRAPEPYRRELEAAAEAAALTEEELDALIVGNVMAELHKFGECSSLLVEAPRSATGGPVFGRNMDYSPRGILDRYGLVTIFRPKGKHAFASVGIPGAGGVISGMNDAGLALATHSAGRSRGNDPALNPLGTPLYITVRRILEECASLEEAEEFLRRNKPYTKGVLLAACDAKRAVVFEMTTRQIVTREPEDHFLICTNHYRTPELCLAKECWRYETLARLWQRETLLGCSDLMQAMRSVGHEKTIQSMVFEPKSLRLHVALGILWRWDGPFATLDLTTLFKHRVAH
ncbi:MAG: C45 family autoproteolytic acyltransferase/hydrolase [Planctomycetota bacterium]